MSTETTALTNLADDPKSVRAILNSDAGRAQFAAALPKHLTPDRFCRVAMTALSRTPKLQDCTKESLFKCLMDLSSMGLEPDGRRAHLIPYGKECTLIVDYKGFVELVMRSGLVSNLHADKVCQNDMFEYDRGEVVTHRIDFRAPRGNAYCYYARVTFKDGTTKAEVMSKEDIESIRQRSRSGNAGPWKTDYDEMAKKTVFRRLSKWLTLSPEIRDAVTTDDEHSFARGMANDTIDVTSAAPPKENPFASQPNAIDVEPPPENDDGIVVRLTQTRITESAANASKKWKRYDAAFDTETESNCVCSTFSATDGEALMQIESGTFIRIWTEQDGQFLKLLRFEVVEGGEG
ncbi:MAG: recombination and repair protein RecT [Akkermansiaceae bacterium]|nr:recombination and repair protein RecT [Akkermansiaceae bacterium]